MGRGLHDLFDDNRSVWLRGKAPYEPSPPLKRQLVVDVAIIGGGFTGVSTAYHLSARFPDRRIAILEARTLANGASGRNGGQMLNWVHGVDPEHPDEARRIYEATREGIDGILSAIEEHGLTVPHGRDGHLDVFVDSRKADEAAAAAEGFRSAGLPIRFLTASELSEHVELRGVKGALLDPEGGHVDGVALVRGLKSVLEDRGVEIFEHTAVTSITEGSTVELKTPSGTVRAGAVVLATNAYTPHLGYFRSGLVPLHSHVVGSESRPVEQWRARGWKHGSSFTDDRDRLSYGTLSASGHLIFGGGSNQTYDYVFGNGTSLRKSGDAGFASNRRQLLRYLPKVNDVPLLDRWTGPIALTLSRICTIGVRGVHRNVYFGLGYSGHGVTMSNLAGRVITDIYSGSDERWRGLPFYQQRLRYIPPEPFRWLGYQIHTRLTGRSPRSRGTGR